MIIRDVTPYLLRGEESYGSSDEGEATDQGDWLLLIRVRTEDGVEGWADVETCAPVAARVIEGPGMGMSGFRALGELLAGADASDLDQLWEQMYIATVYYGRRGVVMQCISAIDNALHAIHAQYEGVSLGDHLGGRRHETLRAYASTLFRPSPEANGQAARAYVQRGFAGVKFGWGGFGVDAAKDRATLEAITEELGPDRTLMVDPGWFIHHERQPRPRSNDELYSMFVTLADFEVAWVEDVMHPEHLGGFRDLHRRFPDVVLAAGEQQATVPEFEQLLELGVSVLQPDLSRCGGLSIGKRVAASAARQGATLVTHSWLTDLLHASSLHLLSTLTDAPWVEFNVAQSRLSRSVVRHPLQMSDDGWVTVPDAVGLGVDVDTEFVTAQAVGRS